jgi:N-acetylneuraminate lyase
MLEPDIIYKWLNLRRSVNVRFKRNDMKVLLDHPQLIGIKHTSQDLYGLERMKSAYPDKIYFNGYDEQFHAALSAGANAAIGTTVNLFYPKFQAIREAHLNGNIVKASALQTSINEAIEVMVSVGIFNAVKYIFAKRGLDCGICRAPFHPLTDADKGLLQGIV